MTKVVLNDLLPNDIRASAVSLSSLVASLVLMASRLGLALVSLGIALAVDTTVGVGGEVSE